VRPLVEVSGLRIAVDGRAREVVRGVDFEIPRGGTVGFVGESGSGKTLICRSLLGLLPPGVDIVGGCIRYDDRDLVGLSEREWRTMRGAEIAAVFQDPASYLNPSIRVGHQLSEVLRVRTGLRRRDAKRRAIDLLERLGLHRPELVYGQYSYGLSGGMLQRVLLAIALAVEPRLLIADEATTALDVTIQAEVLDVVSELQRQTGLTVLIVSHDLAVVAQVCDTVYVLQHGRVVEHGPTGRVLTEHTESYTRRLVDSHLAFGVEHVRHTAVST
jgi:ABC-type dipeptide/oligopeptide/nickel transport system ATPase component